MFSTPMTEPNQNVMEIEELGEETVREMLEYIYTGETKALEENSMNLLKINAHYQVVASVKVKILNLDMQKFHFHKKVTYDKR